MTARARREAAAPAATPRRAPGGAARTAPRPRPVRRTASARRPRFRMGVLWIPVIAVLLGGIVWVNVAKLQMTTTTSRVVDRAQRVEAETVRLRARLGQRNAVVIDRAQDRLDMRIPAEGDVEFLDPVVP